MTSETNEQNAYGSDNNSVAPRNRSFARRCGGINKAGSTTGGFLRVNHHHASAAKAATARRIQSQVRSGPNGTGSRIGRISWAAAELVFGGPAGTTKALEF